MMRRNIIISVFILCSSAFNQLPAQVRVHLSVMGNSLTKGEPVLITISVSNQLAQYAAQVNRNIDRELSSLNEELTNQKISREEYNLRRAALDSNRMAVPVIELGSSKKPWYELAEWRLTDMNSGQVMKVPRIKYLPFPPAGDKILFDEHAFAVAYFGIEGLPEGKYKVTASLNQSEASGLFSVENEPFDFSRSARNHIMNFCRYYYHSGEPAKAIPIISALLSRDSTDAEALSLRGDLLVQQKEYRKALADYENAYRLLDGQGEPLAYLAAMIAWLRQKEY